ncbi:Uncharacterised protein [Candidatus Burarchaeum australiense]|nr:Uncharacterised protein [Candidatus Burarchaeum australiense]
MVERTTGVQLHLPFGPTGRDKKLLENLVQTGSNHENANEMKSTLQRLRNRLDRIFEHTGTKVTLRGFFDYCRYEHYARDLIAIEGRSELSGVYAEREMKRLEGRYAWLGGSKNEVAEALATLASVLADTEGLPPGSGAADLWKSYEFRINHRVTKLEELRWALEELGLPDFEGILGIVAKAINMPERYGLSIMPAALVKSWKTITKFVPKVIEIYEPECISSRDTYGLFSESSKVIARLFFGKEGAKKWENKGYRVAEETDRFFIDMYLASRKFVYAVLENVTSFCCIGCADCYKGPLTRLENANEIRHQLTLDAARALEQTELLVEWLNKNPHATEVIISGGEPLQFELADLERIVNAFREAKYLRMVRICTSAVYQGLDCRIIPEFASMLKEFEQKCAWRAFEAADGYQPKLVCINAHVTNVEQLTDPDAMRAKEILEEYGILVHLQLPLQQRINFSREEVKKAYEELMVGVPVEEIFAKYEMLGLMREFLREAHYQEDDAYKCIIDMHSSSSPELTVPIEDVMKFMELLRAEKTLSDQALWTVHNLLGRQGNLYLPLEGMKELDREAGIVRYFIAEGASVFTHVEPIIEGHNDDLDSFPKPTDSRKLANLENARTAYIELNKKVAPISAELKRIGGESDAEIEEIAASKTLDNEQKHEAIEAVKKREQEAFRPLIEQLEHLTKAYDEECGVRYVENVPLIIEFGCGMPRTG